MVKYVYTLGASGERIKVEELDRTVEYTYDELYRLTSETITEGKKVTTYTYAYDSVSNRTLKTVNGDETVYTYNALNQLISENDTTYEYDNAGNLVRVIGSGKSALYEYNSENKLVKATVQQGNTVVVEEYTYDYEGNRTSKATTTSDGNVEYIQYLNDNSSLTNVLVEIGSENVYYTVGADLISQEVDGEVYTYIYDGHGTVRALADEDGKITDTYSYDAFGNLLSSTGSTANSYLYCGEQYDSTTGLYYLRARYMDTSTGRFISMDTYQGSTADPISLHKYLYANSNPVMYTDPSGYMSLADTMTACAVLGTLSGGMINAGYNVLRFLIGDPEMTSKYDSPVTAYINGFLDGMIWGLFVGISIGTFLTLGVYIGLIVSINFGCSYWHYLEGKSAAESGKWDWAIINLFYSVFYMYAGFTTVGMAMDTHTMLPENMPDENANSTSNSNNNSLPIDNDSQMNHIFSDAYGHIPDTPQNRQLLLSCGTNDAYYNGTDSYGNDWYIRPISETEYVWVESRNGVIWDGGISDRKLNWSDETGYKPPKKH